jgi:hypothetical protein
MAPNDKAGLGKGGDRDKSLETALAQIERQFGLVAGSWRYTGLRAAARRR